jgi:hypothetical protein
MSFMRHSSGSARRAAAQPGRSRLLFAKFITAS